jgi:hypothetical protein
LSWPRDILAAFTGIGNLICEALGGNLIYGLPSSHFDWALLREARDAPCARVVPGFEKFPSWSWCGWRDQVMEYKEKLLASYEDNVHDWLTNHTWITWYIRDGNGKLRLLWDGKSSQLPAVSDKAEVTWKGHYITRNHDSDTHDKYGRFVHLRERRNRIVESDNFNLVLDECPYGVDISNQIDSDNHARSGSTEQDMPYLQFRTWSAYFRIEEDPAFVPENGMTQPEQSQVIFPRYSLLDYKDDWYGTILLDKYWIELPENSLPTRDMTQPLEFIALSDDKHFATGEDDAWGNYIPMTREESSWDLYYVMLIETKAGISTRVGLGKVFKDAFKNSCRPERTSWKEFIFG